MRLASNPQPEVFMRFLVFRIVQGNNHLFSLLHKFETQLTVLKDDPSTWLHTSFDSFSCRFLLTFSHRYFFCCFLFLSCEVINCTCRISTRRKQEENRYIELRFCPYILHRIWDRVDELLTENSCDKFGTGDKSSILSDTSNQKHLHKGSHFLFLLTHSLGKIRNRIVFRVVLLEVLKPSRLVLLY